MDVISLAIHSRTGFEAVIFPSQTGMDLLPDSG
jgi:hypothetical protein